MGFQIYCQVINRAGNIADFGHKYDKGFGKQAAHPLPILLGVPSFWWGRLLLVLIQTFLNLNQ